MSFAMLPTEIVFANTLAVIAHDDPATLTVLQSRVHEGWARRFGSSMKDDLRYTPTDCFETFPFPLAWPDLPVLERVGREYYEYRAALMVELNEGLTKVYNRFHDANDVNPRIVRLRELHDDMDRAVLDAFGWTDIRPTCEFIPEDESGDDKAPAKKTKFRYRWPDDVRDEVLARLLELNADRAASQVAGNFSAARPVRGKKPTPDAPRLFGEV